MAAKKQYALFCGKSTVVMMLPKIQTTDSFNHRFGHCRHAHDFH
jgi:hypothetical protein